MAINWWECLCRSPTNVKIGDIRTYSEQRNLQTSAPIDLFFNRIEALIKLGTPELLNESADIGAFYLVGLISYTENYFREIFARLLEICPISQEKSSMRDIKLGSVIWFKTGRVERGAFEGHSFASAENLIATVQKFFDHKITEKNDCYALLQEFDKLCELRHGVVHSAGIMSGKNALKLQLPRTDNDTVVILDFLRFQEAAQICMALVTTFNTEIFKLMGLRWRDEWPKKLPAWTSTIGSRLFTKLWRLFYSIHDKDIGLIILNLTKEQCKKEIMKL